MSPQLTFGYQRTLKDKQDKKFSFLGNIEAAQGIP